eukprot:gb/GFBE01033186.1/.p1 GENE.gb/GFBE01033186.1/~~gb/GFBE01033186.1/.p1  ORF type:complete len:225 (+),score=26.44 gb/GFBE01033186.1/:1-675(+)
MASLRLPDLGMHRMPDEEELRFAACLKVASEEQEDVWSHSRIRGSGASSFGGAEPSASRTRRSSGEVPARRATGLGGRASLEDFLGGSPRRSGRAGVRPARGPVRPTQRQPIDDETSVPAEVYQKMMQLGSEARVRATHRKAFAPVTGEPYLEHHDAARLRAERAAAEAAAIAAQEAAVAASLPYARPHSACATEAMESMAMEGCGRWGNPESAATVPMPLQVI